MQKLINVVSFTGFVILAFFLFFGAFSEAIIGGL